MSRTVTGRRAARHNEREERGGSRENMKTIRLLPVPHHPNTPVESQAPNLQDVKGHSASEEIVSLNTSEHESSS